MHRFAFQYASGLGGFGSAMHKHRHLRQAALSQMATKAKVNRENGGYPVEND
jgi:hypothetical protein